MVSARPKDIFLDSLELPEQERESFILQACGSNVTLLAEVRALMVTHEQAKGFLHKPAIVDPTWIAGEGGPSPSSPASRELSTGDTVDAEGRYRLVNQLGEGGFGVVWLAEQLEPVRRHVALKVIRRGMDVGQIVQRFEAERQALAVMDHPNIAKVYDAGETAAHDRPYFVMEYVAGGLTITQYCRQHNLNVRQKLELMEKVCLAVQHAHTKGIIHRDLKPGNILVSEIDGQPEPKVIDFGVAKAADPVAASIDNPHVTQELQIIGTPQYMSPEQATTGPGRSIDTRSDVYSLGTIMYELMAGVPPFDADLLRKSSIDEVCRLIREHTPPKPSSRLSDSPSATTQLRRQIAGEVDWIVMRAMEKEPSRRYQSAAEMAVDIRRHLNGEAVLAGAPSVTYQLRKLAKRYRLQITAAAVVLVALMATAVISTVMAAKARKAEALANEQRDKAQLELSRANAIADFTGDILTGIDPAVAKGRDTSLLGDILADAAKRVPELAPQAPIEAAIRSMIGTAYYDIGQAQKAIAELQKSYDLSVNDPGCSPEELAKVATTLGAALSEVDRFADAEKILSQTVNTLEARGSSDNPVAMDARVNLGSIYLHVGRNQEAKELFTKLLADRIRVQGERAERTLLEMSNLATAHRRLGELGAARDLWERSLKLHREILGNDHVQTGVVMNNLATLYEQLRMPAEAEALYRETLAAKRAIFPEGHPSLIRSIANLGGFLEREGKIEEAEKLVNEAVTMARKSLGPDDQQTLHAEMRLAALLRRQEKWDEAIALLERVHVGFVKAVGLTHGDAMRALSLRLATLADARRFDEGLRVLTEHEPKPMPVDEIAPDHIVTLHANAGRIYVGLGRIDDARQRVELAKPLAGKESVTSAVRERLAQLETSIAAASTQPSTVPAQ